MSSKNKAIFCLLFVAAVALILAQPGLAHEPPPPPPTPFRFPTMPRLFPWDPEELMKCWSSLLGVKGCKREIFRAFFTGQFMNVGSVCCKAYLATDANCWSRMFPLSPLFPPLLKDGCSRIVGMPDSPIPKVGAPAAPSPK